MIIIAGTIDFEDEEHRNTALEQSRPLQQATRDDESGCLAYCFAADPCVSTRIQVYELWTTGQSLDDHFDHDNYHNMRKTLGGNGMVGSDTRKFRIDADDPVYGEDRIASSKFWSVEGD